MIVVRITSLLANQMFAYASIKTIAKDKGYDFKYIHEHCLASERSNSSVDKKYGKDFDSIFGIPKEEELSVFDSTGYVVHEEFDYIKRYDSFYYEEAKDISDCTFAIVPKSAGNPFNEAEAKGFQEAIEAAGGKAEVK